MKKLLSWLYFNWFLTSLAGTMLGYALSFWSAWWILAPVSVLAILTVIAIVPCLWFLRFITWPFAKKQMEVIIDRVNSPLLGYPMLIWITLEGKDVYIKGGDLAFKRAFAERADKVGEGLKTWAESLKPKNEQN